MEEKFVVRFLKHFLLFGGILFLGTLLYFGFMVLTAYQLFQKNQERIQHEISELKTYLDKKKTEEALPEESTHFTLDENGDLMTPVPLRTEALLPSRILDRNGRIIGEYVRQDQKRLYELTELPPYVVQALLVTEDRSFYTHHGYSLRGIARATLVNLMHLRTKQGASTLTQQLAKILFTTRAKIYSRKLFELFCALELEKQFTKDQLLLFYLNFAYFGQGCYGIENASFGLFGKSASALTAVEGAHLISVLANPSLYSPRSSPELSKKRHELVMGLLVSQGQLSESYAKREFERHWQDIDAGYLSKVTSLWGMSLNKAPYFNEQIRRKLDHLFTNDEIQTGGYEIHTSLDIDLQEFADQQLTASLKELNQKFVSTQASEKVEGAVVILDHESGDFLASVGGSGFGIYNQLIRSTQIRRPIGSLVKPFLASLALDQGYTPEQEIEDKPLKISIPGRTWAPMNYDQQFLGQVTLAQALISSRNIPFVNILKDLGPKPLMELIEQGASVDSSRLPRNLSLGLGSCDLSPLEVAKLYALFPRLGVPLEVEDLILIQKDTGEIIYDEREFTTRNHSQTNKLFSEASGLSVSALMEEVLTSTSGTAHGAAQQLGFSMKAAGKTGTTQNYRDAWFAGFTKSYTMVVWLGIDRNVALEGATGGRVAAPVWLKTVMAIGDR